MNLNHLRQLQEAHRKKLQHAYMIQTLITVTQYTQVKSVR